jgi:hypothetical protein
MDELKPIESLASRTVLQAPGNAQWPSARQLDKKKGANRPKFDGPWSSAPLIYCSFLEIAMRHDAALLRFENRNAT